VAEVIHHDVDGMLIDSAKPEDLAQACVKLLSEPGRLSRMAAAGRESVQEFDVRKRAAQVAQLYFSLCGIEN
jgi:glycosyltransferase involved in cell wall biosynthesis